MTNQARILVVDDEPRFCKSIETLLFARNYAVKTCGNGYDAINLLQKKETDLVLLDVYMEKMDGFQTIQKIIDQKKDVPVIIITGQASIDSAVKALRMGAIDYLRKPFEHEELFSSVKKALDQKALKKKLKEIEQKCKVLVSTMPQGIVLVDLEGKIIFSNPAHHRMFGYSKDELIDKYIWELVAGETDRIKTKDYFMHIIQERPEPEPYFMLDSTRDGRLIHTQINWDYVRDPKGELTGIISVISDITAQKQAEQGREKLLKALHDALENVKTLSGMLPICANCKNIRDDQGYWNSIEAYIEKHSDASFTHGVCPSCSEQLYGNADWYIDMKKTKK